MKRYTIKINGYTVAEETLTPEEVKSYTKAGAILIMKEA